MGAARMLGRCLVFALSFAHGWAPPQVPVKLARWRFATDESEVRSEEATVADAPPAYFTGTVRPLTLDDVVVQTSRSGGAGGQNVNKVETKAEVRLDVASAWIPPLVRAKLEVLQKNRISKEGTLVVTSQKHRTQKANIAEALERVQDMLDAALEAAGPPKEASEEKVKRIAKLKKKDNQKRLDKKKQQSDKKKSRRGKIEW